MKFLFCRIAWMEFYQGFQNDHPIGGGKYPEEEEVCYEAYNFNAIKGEMFGYVTAPGKRKININRLGARPNDNFIDNITVIWLAPKPTIKGKYIIGWYKNARIYRNYQNMSPKSKRCITDSCSTGIAGYHFKTGAPNAYLLTPDERTFSIPAGKKERIGTAQIWYCDAHTPRQNKFLKEVEDYIKYQNLPSRLKKKPATIKTRQRDEKLKKEIELAGMNAVTKYFANLGYTVEDIHLENRGYDLVAYLLNERLLLEVKGLSGQNVTVEMTPNEYETMMGNKLIYRVCVVTGCLMKIPNIHIFRYSNEKEHWLNRNNDVLQIQEKIGAKLFI